VAIVMATKQSWFDRLRGRGRARRGTGSGSKRDGRGLTAFVLSGGGNLGAIQVGMLRALFEAGVKPDLILGCSVGALNGAGVAEEPSLIGVARLEELWRDLEGKDLMPTGWFPNTVALARRGEAVHDLEPLRKLAEGALTARTFEELRVPFQCVATDMAGVREVWFSTGPLIEPILASSAIPALYPGVVIDGVRYHDGAIVDDVPMARAVELGATTIYVLQVGAYDRPRPEPRRPLDVAIQAYWVARNHRFKRELAAMPDDIEVLVLPTPELPVFRFNDFTHSAELMSAADDATSEFLRRRAGKLPTPTETGFPIAEPQAEAVDARGASAPAEPREAVPASVDAAREATASDEGAAHV
jgi:NTE family protein